MEKNVTAQNVEKSMGLGSGNTKTMEGDKMKCAKCKVPCQEWKDGKIEDCHKECKQ